MSDLLWLSGFASDDVLFWGVLRVDAMSASCSTWVAR